MEFGGDYLFSAPRQQVWAALNDTAVLQAAIPGCRRIDWTGADELELELSIRLGIVQPVFTGDLRLSDIVPAERYTLSGRGRGGVLGMAHGAAQITLADAPGGTRLQFRAVGGADSGIMKLGRALIGKSAQRVIDGFVGRFAAAMGVDVAPLAEPPEATAP
jgi:uncharacterized protein